MICNHEWLRSEETKPYARGTNFRKMEYIRAVSTCTRCGRRSVAGWNRRQKRNEVKST